MSAPVLTPSEHRAIALAAEGLLCADVLARLVSEGLPVPPTGLGGLWSGAARKLGASHSRRGQQPELVYRAYVHGCLDVPAPEDPGWLPTDLLALLQALAAGRTLKEYAGDSGVPLSQVEAVVRHARRKLGDVSLAGLGHRASPSLAVGGDIRTGLQPVGVSPVVTAFQTDLPGDVIALSVGRGWVRDILFSLGWRGPAVRASEVAAHLVSIAVRHGLPENAPPQCHLLLRASVTEAGELMLDVTDHNPAFPEFDRAGRGAAARGLRRIARLDAKVSWFPVPHGTGKTARAILSRPEEAAG